MLATSTRGLKLTLMSGVFSLLSALSPAAWAFGQADDDAPSDGGPGSLPARGNGVAAETGVGQQQGDLIWTLSLIMALDLPVPSLGCLDPTSLRCITRFRVGARLPVQSTITAADPNAPQPQDGSVWDHLQLRYLEYGYVDEPVHILFGELAGVSLGHGTIVNEYYNVINNSRFQLGMQANLNSPYAGAEVLVDNIASPSLVAGRAYVRPLAMITGVPWLNQLGFGFSLLSDLNAPVSLSRTGFGQVRRDAFGLPVAARTDDATFFSTDVELDLLHLPRVRIGSYADLNWHLSRGMGAHLGAHLKIDPLRSLAISARAEYRWLGAGYLPDYFGPLYEIERFQAIGSGPTSTPKLGRLLGTRGTPKHGSFAQLSATVFDIVTLSGAITDYEGQDNTQLWARLAVAPIDIYSMSVFYYKTNITDPRSITTSGDSSLAAEARLGIIWPVYIFGQYSNLWSAQAPDSRGQLAQWRAGLGASFSL